MHTRCRQDLSGCRSQMQSTLTQWNEKVASVTEVWNDETAQTFFQQNLHEIEPIFKRMMRGLQEALVQVHNIEKKVADIDRFGD